MLFRHTSSALRKICVVIGSRANYGSIKSAMRAIREHPELSLQIVVGASALLDRYGSVVDLIEDDGFIPEERIHMLIEGETPLTMAQSTGFGLIELARVFDRLKPDIVLTVGDRFETMATAVAAAYMNIPLAHTMGGEISGTIDESIRHAVTKLAHIHFPANDHAAERIVRMGENPESVHVVGCPRMDIVAEIAAQHPNPPSREWLEKEGVGGHIHLSSPYLLVMQHPVTTEYGQGEKQIGETLAALQELNLPAFMLWPNADAGSEDISRGMRKFRERESPEHIRFYKNLPLSVFVPLLAHAACMVGNSSAAIREGSFLGIPAVNIGTRQLGRERGGNTIDVPHQRGAIADAVRRQIAHGTYEANSLYGDGKAGKRIANILASTPLVISKRMTY
ncbi:MAG: UDP-N-acetylglucosamine 2-epimerase [Patescibacteria group bacterium]